MASHVWIPGTCKYAMLHDKKDIADVIMVW